MNANYGSFLIFQLSDPVVYVASHMANVHNTFIRTLNTIYLQAPYITTPRLAADFFQYCRSLGSLLYLHHSQEEAVLFPKLEKLSGQKGLMEVNVHQHDVFQPKLAEFNTYVETTKPGDYSAEKMKELIDAFAPALMTHLSDEIPTLMALRKYGKDVQKAHDEFEAEVRRIVDAVGYLSSFITPMPPIHLGPDTKPLPVVAWLVVYVPPKLS
jgi:hemerythrin-like domain-containing protein